MHQLVGLVMVLKEKVINCFNSKAYTYAAAADIQPLVAELLASQLSDISARSVLEIGCGTGLFSQYLTQYFPTAKLLLTDIAPAMVEICQERFKQLSRVSVMCMDGELLTTSTQFDLIASSMTLHWFVDLQQSLQSIIEKLAPGGRFIFAVLGQNSLQEWRHICRVHNASVPTPIFPTGQELQTMIPDLKVQIDVLQQHYHSAQDFLNTLKALGANAAHADHEPLSPGVLRRIMRAFDHASFEGMNITYEIIYGSYIKQ